MSERAVSSRCSLGLGRPRRRATTPAASPFRRPTTTSQIDAVASPSTPSTSTPSTFRTPGSPVAAPTTPVFLQLLIESLFNFPPIFDSAVKAARKKISDRGLSVGVDIERYARELKESRDDWDSALSKIADPGLTYPEYYLAPFHCYETGNLNWESALEGPASSKAVHAPVMSEGTETLDPDGDGALRSSHSAVASRLIREAFNDQSEGFDFERRGLVVVDLGCSVGLSTRELGRVFPNAELVGIDLSPHMLAVFEHLQGLGDEEASLNQIPEAAGSIRPARGRKARLVHAAAESTGLDDSSVDVASMHLVMHELPQRATRDILREAFRILKPGGVVVLGEMDPGSPAFGRVLSSPFAFAAFRSSEPHLLEYITLDVPAAAREAGFASVRTEAHSPRHFTLVGVKPFRK